MRQRDVNYRGRETNYYIIHELFLNGSDIHLYYAKTFTVYQIPKTRR